MEKDRRTAVYDFQLSIAAYCFEGMIQPFASHFHPYYVIGLIEEGKRDLLCNAKRYLAKPESILIFHPGEIHSCVAADGTKLKYRSLIIDCSTMQKYFGQADGFTKKEGQPVFQNCISCDEEVAEMIRQLTAMFFEGAPKTKKENALCDLLTLLKKRYLRADPAEEPTRIAEKEKYRDVMDAACACLKESSKGRVGLDRLCLYTALSKPVLLRRFFLAAGMSPCRYLDVLRLQEAEKRLKEGMRPIEAALLSGYYDQSHFSRAFSRYCGLTPGQYRKMYRNTKGIDHEK